MYGSVRKEEVDSLLPTGQSITVNENRTLNLIRSPRFLLGTMALVVLAVFGISYQGSNVSDIGKLSFKSDKVIDDDHLLEIILDKLQSEGDGTSSCTCSDADNTEVSHGGEADYVTATCTDSTSAAMGGADLVEYFNQHESGKDYTTFPGQLGDSTITATYAGYTFNFISTNNQEKFISNPTFYIPQNGGFCSMAISAEFCPLFSWDAACLGPNGELSSWEIIDNKLYFFLDETAKNIFDVDRNNLIEIAATRWAQWFSIDEKAGIYTINTACVQSGTVIDVNGDIMTADSTSDESEKVPGGKTSTTSSSTENVEGGKVASTTPTSSEKTDTDKVPGGKLA